LIVTARAGSAAKRQKNNLLNFSSAVLKNISGLKIIKTENTKQMIKAKTHIINMKYEFKKFIRYSFLALTLAGRPAGYLNKK
jgi:hypothetical protein